MNRKHRHQHNYEVVENQSLTVEQINKLRKVYTFFDKDEKAKGRLVASDLFALMKELGRSLNMNECQCTAM